MKTITCRGTPHEIGLGHGQAAAQEIKRALAFYEKLFKETTKLSWDEVCQEAAKFDAYLNRVWPCYVHEMDGIAEGAHAPYKSILALNVRTEIAYGMFSDGCTALSWQSGNNSYLAQNWDWRSEQAENLVRLRIQQHGKPSIDMITEAGIIGKIGLNSAGVGVCLNAIRARGVDFGKLPCHLALRYCLDSASAEEAATGLQKVGVASSCHILLADIAASAGIECSHLDMVELPRDDRGIVTHTNHYIKDHPGVDERYDLPDTTFRLKRINELLDACVTGPEVGTISKMLRDEENSPVAICRSETKTSTVATLFSIVMTLNEMTAVVTIGSPVNVRETLFLNPSDEV